MSSDPMQQAAERLGKSHKRSARVFLVAMRRLKERGIVRSKIEFAKSLGGSEATSKLIVTMLVRHGIFASNKQPHPFFEMKFSEDGLKNYLGSNPCVKSFSSPIRCPECGARVTELADDICRGCSVRRSVNAEREGRVKV